MSRDLGEVTSSAWGHAQPRGEVWDLLSSGWYHCGSAQVASVCRSREDAIFGRSGILMYILPQSSSQGGAEVGHSHPFHVGCVCSSSVGIFSLSSGIKGFGKLGVVLFIRRRGVRR